MTLTPTKAAKLQETLEAGSGPEEGLYIQKAEDNNMALTETICTMIPK